MKKSKSITLADLRRAAPKGWTVNRDPDDSGLIKAVDRTRNKIGIWIWLDDPATARRACLAALRAMEEK